MTPKSKSLILACWFLTPLPFTFAGSDYDRQIAELTAQREKAISEATEPINRRYQTSLEQLLRKATQANDLDAAVKIKNAIAAADPPGSRFHGWWATESKSSRLQFTAGGNFQEHWKGTIQEGRWQPASGPEVKVTMKSGTVREYRLSDDGRTVKRLNDGVTWRRDD